MDHNHPLGFETFLARHRADLSRIARASRGEQNASDVPNEAWILAYDIGAKRGRSLDLDCEQDATLLLRYLYNRCARFTETIIRHADRLDHAAAGDDERGQH